MNTQTPPTKNFSRCGLIGLAVFHLSFGASSAVAQSSAPASQSSAPSDPDDLKVQDKASSQPNAQEKASSSRPAKESAKHLDDDVVLKIDQKSEKAFARCASRALEYDDTEMQECLNKIIRLKPGTTGAFQASTGLEYLESQHDVQPDRFQPGSVELSAVAGLYGLWGGLVLGGIAASHIPDVNEVAVLGVGALGVGSAVAFGFGGNYLAKKLEFTAGDARLMASGFIWGTAIGTGLAESVSTLTGDLRWGFANVVFFGALGGGAAGFLATQSDLNIAQVSLINTGGWVGVLNGTLAYLSVQALQDRDNRQPLFAATAYTAVAGLGLAGGAYLGSQSNFSWGETLLVDLGGVIGTVAGLTAFGFLSVSGTLANTPASLGVPLSLAPIAVGSLAGSLGTGFYLHLNNSGSRSDDDTLLSSRRLRVVPMTMLDSNRDVVMGLGLAY